MAEQMKVVGKILYTTRDNLKDEEGATISYLIREANMPHPRISRVLKTMVSQGLLEQVKSGRSSKYRISESGRDFLQEYQTFTRFADSFGLNI